MDAGSLATCITFAGTGVLVIVLGRMGRAGKLDFNLGTYTRDNATPESWIEAHQIMGRSMDQSGWIQIAGAVAIGVFGMHHTLGIAGFTLAILGAFMPVWAIWPTFKVLQRRETEEAEQH